MSPDRVGLVPFLCEDDGLKVVLVSSRDGRRWGLPKGRIDKGRGKREMAHIEAWEEAGVVARRQGRAPVDVPWRQGGRTLTLRLYPVTVDRLAQRFPERGQRRRRVVTLKKARKLLRDPQLARALAGLASRVQEGSEKRRR